MTLNTLTSVKQPEKCSRMLYRKSMEQIGKKSHIERATKKKKNHTQRHSKSMRQNNSNKLTISTNDIMVHNIWFVCMCHFYYAVARLLERSLLTAQRSVLVRYGFVLWLSARFQHFHRYLFDLFLSGPFLHDLQINLFKFKRWSSK